MPGTREKPRHYLREWREFRDLTQEALANKVGTNASVIHLLENGQRGLSDKWLRKLAPALGTMPGAILDYDPNTVSTAVLEAWGDIPEETRPQAMRVLEAFRKRRA